MKLNGLILFVVALSLVNCAGKVDEIPEDRFIGTWELKGRSLFEGIQVKIEKQDKSLVGKITKLNANKLVRMFADTSDVWVSGIKRSSNFEFKLTEKKIAKDLFSLYGLSTSQDFKIQFIDENTIGLAPDNSDPQYATILYKRVLQ